MAQRIEGRETGRYGETIVMDRRSRHLGPSILTTVAVLACSIAIVPQAFCQSTTLPPLYELCQLALVKGVTTYSHDVLTCRAKTSTKAARRRESFRSRCLSKATSVFSCITTGLSSTGAKCRNGNRLVDDGSPSCPPESVTARGSISQSVPAFLFGVYDPFTSCVTPRGKKARRAFIRCEKRLAKRLSSMITGFGECYSDLGEAQNQDVFPLPNLTDCLVAAKTDALKRIRGCPDCVDATATFDTIAAAALETLQAAFKPCSADSQTICPETGVCMKDFCDGWCQSVPRDDNLSCAADDDMCVKHVCHAGTCFKEANNNGQPCGGENNKCVACSGGTCGPAVVSCEDGNVCSVDNCDPKTGCTHSPYLPNSKECNDNDGNACTVGFCGSDLKCNPTPKQCPGVQECVAGACIPREEEP